MVSRKARKGIMASSPSNMASTQGWSFPVMDKAPQRTCLLEWIQIFGTENCTQVPPFTSGLRQWELPSAIERPSIIPREKLAPVCGKVVPLTFQKLIAALSLGFFPKPNRISFNTFRAWWLVARQRCSSMVLTWRILTCKTKHHMFVEISNSHNPLRSSAASPAGMRLHQRCFPPWRPSSDA